MELTMNNAKDLRGDSVEIIVSGDEGAYIAVNSGREQHSYRLQAGNDISLSRVTNALMSFEENFNLNSFPSGENAPEDDYDYLTSRLSRSMPEGAIVKRHTSAVVNLQNRAHSITYLDIPIEETPVVPYQAWRRYIFGSPACIISFTGWQGRAGTSESRQFALRQHIEAIHVRRIVHQLGQRSTQCMMDCRTGRQWTFRLLKSNTRTRGHSDGRASTPAAIQKPSKRRVTVSFLCWRTTASQQHLTTSSSGSRQCECPTIPSDWHCFNHSVRRWFGVANMTLHRGALLYEANARGT
ncbi:unnamed protein product [Nesidiocoris tenuis]|uniref:Uncharacterized protein n=1 Tax=Nesidiocoris tenuis TaxID=355587 RepID=A0A6H5GIF1_9HEMI|nr:unnamed protein product [Nesidiocoris tenuis]